MPNESGPDVKQGGWAHLLDVDFLLSLPALHERVPAVDRTLLDLMLLDPVGVVLNDLPLSLLLRWLRS